ncbi:hypothetical protein Xen7305DRAFT_00045520 [Xenococcus sp. PCC 7305]|nr:hypothetical protein Xen7305DRAFT_00045520 [Xenococcus sp. PCC 7305]
MRNPYYSTSSRSVIQTKPLGIVLQEAHLITDSKIEVALRDQEYYPYLRLGEILAMRGWIKQETADFFAQDWSKLTRQKTRRCLGYYLQKAALLQPQDIDAILEEQKMLGIRFGSIAVLRGLLESQTLDFFLMNLFPQEIGKSSLVSKSRFRVGNSQRLSTRIRIPNDLTHRTTQKLTSTQTQIEELESTEIKWID